MLFLGHGSHERLGRCKGGMVSHITQIFFVLGTVMGQNWGSNLPKRCLYPVKSQYKCYIWVTGHMRGWGDVKVTQFEISTKFTLFCEVNGSKTGSNSPKILGTYFFEYNVMHRFIRVPINVISCFETKRLFHISKGYLFAGDK